MRWRFLGGHITATHDVDTSTPEARGCGGSGLASNGMELAKLFGGSVGNPEDIYNEAVIFGFRHQIGNQVEVDVLLDYALDVMEARLGRKAVLSKTSLFLRGDWLALDQCQQGFQHVGEHVSKEHVGVGLGIIFPS